MERLIKLSQNKTKAVKTEFKRFLYSEVVETRNKRDELSSKTGKNLSPEYQSCLVVV
jgi:hypothetical protein